MESKKKEEFAKIYSENISSVYRYVNSRLYNREQSEEITSKTIETAYDLYMRDDSEKIENPKAWLFQIARNHMGNLFRKKKYELSPDPEIEFEDGDLSMEDVVINNEQVEIIKEVFQDLEPESREVLSLKIWEDKKFNEIAYDLGINESTAKTLYYRAVKKVKDIMDEKELAKLAAVVFGIQKLGSDPFFMPDTDFVAQLIEKIDPELVLKVGAIVGGVATTATGVAAAKSAAIVSATTAASTAGKAVIVEHTITIFGKVIALKHLVLGTAAVATVGTAAVATVPIVNNLTDNTKVVEVSDCFKTCSPEDLYLEARQNTLEYESVIVRETVIEERMPLSMRNDDEQPLVDVRNNVRETEYQIEDANHFRSMSFDTSVAAGEPKVITEETIVSDNDAYWILYHPQVEEEPIWEYRRRELYDDVSSISFAFLTTQVDKSIRGEYFLGSGDMVISEVETASDEERMISVTLSNDRYSQTYEILITSDSLPKTLAIAGGSIDDDYRSVYYEFSNWGDVEVDEPENAPEPPDEGTILIEARGTTNPDTGSPLKKICLQQILYPFSEKCAFFSESAGGGNFSSGFITAKSGAYYAFTEFSDGTRDYYTNSIKCLSPNKAFECYEGDRSHNLEIIIFSPSEDFAAIKATDPDDNECHIYSDGTEGFCGDNLSESDWKELGIWQDSEGIYYNFENLTFDALGLENIGLPIQNENYAISERSVDGKTAYVIFTNNSYVTISESDENYVGTTQVSSFVDPELLKPTSLGDTYRIDVSAEERFSNSYKKFPPAAAGYGKYFLYVNNAISDGYCGDSMEIKAPCGLKTLSVGSSGGSIEFMCASYKGQKSECDEFIKYFGVR